jgi:hypothetical protein
MWLFVFYRLLEFTLLLLVYHKKESKIVVAPLIQQLQQQPCQYATTE